VWHQQPHHNQVEEHTDAPIDARLDADRNWRAGRCLQSQGGQLQQPALQEQGRVGNRMTKHLQLADTQGHLLVVDPPLARLLFSSTKVATV
jgi:hypothetical protein